MTATEHQPFLPLGYGTQPNPPPRPKESDPAVLKAAAERYLPAVIAWVGNEWRDEMRDDTLESIIAAIEDMPDGYERARALDNEGWEPDAELVEILDMDHIAPAHAEAVKAWVDANQIKPRFAVGDRIAIPPGEIGTISYVDTDQARYTVKTEAFLKKNPHCAGDVRSGYLIPFEQCREVTP